LVVEVGVLPDWLDDPDAGASPPDPPPLQAESAKTKTIKV